MRALYYRPSGRFPLKVIAIAGLMGLLSIPFGWLYALLTFHMPFIYFNFLFAFGFGIVLSLIADIAASSGKARNPFLMGLIGAAIGIAGWYCQWSAWAGMVVRRFPDLEAGGSGNGMFDFLLNPNRLYALAHVINDTGIWTIKHAVVNGFWLTVAWIIELVILVGLPIIMARSQAQKPFCEVTKSWADKQELPKKFAFVSDTEQLTKALESGPGQLLALLKEHPSAELNHVTLELYRCKGSDAAYVSVKNTTISINNGKVKKDRSTFIEYLAVSKATADNIILECSTDTEKKPAADTDSLVDSPLLKEAIAALKNENYAVALEQARPYLSAPAGDVRNDAHRLCALASGHLDQWDAAYDYWITLFESEPTAHNALQVATSSVMVGDVQRGQDWIAKADELNLTQKTVSPVLLRTNFITVLKNRDHMPEALPYLEWMRNVYQSLRTTDSQFLFSHDVPPFSSFLENSMDIVSATMPAVQARAWYESMLEHLDQDGKDHLSAWLAQHFPESAV